MKTSLILALILALGLADARAGEPAPTLYDDLGGHRRPVDTASGEAQRWFDQGLTLLFAFNHDEAIRCFTQATRLDPACAMAWWGIALAHGPHINFPVLPPERAAAAWDALERARALVTDARPADRALVDALGHRYANPPPEDRRPLDEAYAEAMGRVAKEFPEDADVAVLHAEALMDLQPWDLWTLEGEPKGRATQVVGILERALRLDPLHPGANHLYVHAVEASADPARGKPAADRLRDLVPGAGHLLHMPAHIDIRIGDYEAAMAANVRAIEADRKHAERFPRAGFYRIYMAHNHHFLAFAAMLAGRSAVALDAARAMREGIPPEFVEAMTPLVDGFLPVVLHVHVRFGRWEDVLAHPEFPPTLLVSNGVRHYARGVALTALGRVEEAGAELAALDAAIAALDDRPIGNNPAKVVMRVPRGLLAGELAFRRGDREGGLALLREAVAVEDTLVYDEPPDWMMPARHPLGAALLEAGRFQEAVGVFESDLRRFPENGYALLGLSRAHHGLGRHAEAQEVAARFERAWAKADVELPSPCFCQPGGKATAPR